MSSTTATAPIPLKQDAGVIGLVGIGHLISHYSQLLLAPLFPWLKDDFGASYAELGFLMTVFFVVSCGTQAAAGLLVDRYGPRPILFAGLALIGVAAFTFAGAGSYAMLAVGAVIAGTGNGVFHPVDFTLLNRKVSVPRLGHAYSIHGITGTLGWALAPAMLVPLAVAFSWRVALVGAGLLAFAVLALLLAFRERLTFDEAGPASAADAPRAPAVPPAWEGTLGFLRIPAVWMCFLFFFFYAFVVSVVQTFAPEAARRIHDVPVALVAACLTTYMLGSASGMVLGGFLAAQPERCERIVGAGMGVAACIALVIGFAPVPALAVPALFGVMGFAAGMSGPSRDLIVKRATPDGATGRVYGVVYSGLDTGQAIAPLLFGLMMDRQMYQGVWLGLVVVQAFLITSAFNVRRVRRTA